MSLFLAGFVATSAFAQDEPEELDAFISEEIPIEENILPTSRPFNSVYGTDRSILDTPRNVTIISREQLDKLQYKTYFQTLKDKRAEGLCELYPKYHA